MPTTWGMRYALPVRQAWMSPPASNAPRAKRMRTKFVPSSALYGWPRPEFLRHHSSLERLRSCARSSKADRMPMQQPNTFRNGPDERGRFGIYGGRFVAETLMPLILDLERAYAQA